MALKRREFRQRYCLLRCLAFIERERGKQPHKFWYPLFCFLCRHHDASGYTRRAKWRLRFEMGRAKGLSLCTLSLRQTAFFGADGSCLRSDVDRWGNKFHFSPDDCKFRREKVVKTGSYWERIKIQDWVRGWLWMLMKMFDFWWGELFIRN